MPRLTNLTIVRSLLNRDREWAAYAIGDLSPGLVEHSDWHVPARGAPALLLLYRGFEPPITFAMGEPCALGELFKEISAPVISLHVRPEAIDALSGSYAPTHTERMRRMTLRAEAFTPVRLGDVQPVTEQDSDAVSELYEDGHRRGEGPSHFHPAMLQQRTFRGLWEDGALVAIAGTHLYSPEEGVCAIGNVYTRSDRRGRGLAARVTTAVVAHARSEGIPTIVLNVSQHNTTAQRVYERLGFEVYCEFLEGEATRGSSASDKAAHGAPGVAHAGMTSSSNSKISGPRK